MVNLPYGDKAVLKGLLRPQLYRCSNHSTYTPMVHRHQETEVLRKSWLQEHQKVHWGRPCKNPMSCVNHSSEPFQTKPMCEFKHPNSKIPKGISSITGLSGMNLGKFL